MPSLWLSFLGVVLVLKSNSHGKYTSFDSAAQTNKGRRVIISIVEGLLIFLIAMIWRIISFKYTHLTERLQLLTLIIIGEGIIGMVKSVACITKGQTSNNMSEIGTVIAAVLLLVCRHV